MADQYINATGLQAIKTWIKNTFASKTEVQEVDTKVDNLAAVGAQPNTIESITVNGTMVTPDANKNVALKSPTKTSDLTNDGDGTSNFATEAYVTTNGGKIDKISVNGTEQVITDKTVNIVMPTKVSDLTNDGDGTAGSEFATKAYVQSEGGKIDAIKVNGTAQTITNKEVDITVPTKVSDLTNDGDGTAGSTFATNAEVDSKISTAVTSVYKYKGSVATTGDLPTGMTEGDVYNVEASGMNYAWDGTVWDSLGQLIDTSLLWAKDELTAMTVSEINAILEA